MLEIIAWLGCAFLVLKGAEIYLASLRDDFPDVCRSASLIVLGVSVVLAVLFGVLTVREASKSTPAQEAYSEMQESVVKSFEETSRALDEASKPVQEAPGE